MIIGDLSIAKKDNRCRVSAEISYEDFEREKTRIYFEVPSEFKEYLRPSYEAFLFSSFPAALYHHEKRIKIEGEVCSEAVMNVNAALHLQKKWFEPKHAIPTVEAKKEIINYPAEDGLAGCFMSGGVDSLSNFCRNMILYPKDHPSRFKTAVCVYGMDVGDPNKPLREDIFNQTIELLSQLTSKYDCWIIPVYTNARHLEKDWVFYAERHYGALLSGVAHSLGNRLKSCSIALDVRTDHYIPRGSCPNLNKYFVSSYMSVESVMDAYLRLEKYKFLKEIPESLKVLRVCYTMTDIKSNHINCGRCRKCIRTKLELLASGLLDQVATFPDINILADDVWKLEIKTVLEREFMRNLISPLREKGRLDLASILEKKVKNPEYKSLKMRVKEVVKKMDMSFFNGNLRKLITQISG
jgi:hypothetical protein